eukprot:591228-Pelagomonas_calceolata.AAC.8
MAGLMISLQDIHGSQGAGDIKTPSLSPPEDSSLPPWDQFNSISTFEVTPPAALHTQTYSFSLHQGHATKDALSEQRRKGSEKKGQSIGWIEDRRNTQFKRLRGDIQQRNKV